MSAVDTPTLLALEKKTGHVHSLADWHGIQQKSKGRPQDVTDDDLVVLAAFGGPQDAAAARDRRTKALAPPPAPPTPPAAVVTTSVPPAAPQTTGSDDDLTWDEFVVTHADLPMTLQNVADIVEPVLVALHDMNERNKARNLRLDTLEQRVTALEGKPHVKFLGVWKAGESYGPGDAATHHGSLWICQAPQAGEPSKDFHGWTLAVKRGSA